MLTSEELNDGIRTFCDDGPNVPGLSQHGKCVAYIGWYWRDVAFDDTGYRFGVIPGAFAGFMENNKWGYEYTDETTPEQWTAIKEHLSNAVEAFRADDPDMFRHELIAANEIIQSML